MSSPWISGLRSVALTVPDLPLARQFYTGTWGLHVAAETPDGLYLAGKGDDPHVLSLHRGDTVAVRDVTLRARSAQALSAIEQATTSAGGRVTASIAPIVEHGGGSGLVIADPHGRLYRIVHGDTRSSTTTDGDQERDRPLRLAHAVLNSHDVPAAQTFLERALGFRLVDRTRIMAFMNCDRDHHSIAIGDAGNDALNHIAFLMEDVDAVMRGGGRMRDAGYPIKWGPGRHGPGHNAFNYFIGPFGEVIEYTADVEQIDDTYRTGVPADWTWPQGRVDQWGIAPAPDAELKAAQQRIFFVAD